ncbi:MAG TPA: hypothetical protein V6C72_07160 [Chroococcales cyanobacterium]
MQTWLKSITKAFAVCLSLLVVYAIGWGVWARLPGTPLEVIDMRADKNADAYSLTFCAELAANYLGFPGHAFVVCTPALGANLPPGDSVGFVPRYRRDQIRSLFAPVPGFLTHDGNVNADGNPDQLVVLVDREAYMRALALADSWDPSIFKVGEKDCVAMVDTMARSIGLKTPGRQYVFPQEYVHQLKRLNHIERTDETLSVRLAFQDANRPAPKPAPVSQKAVQLTQRVLPQAQPQ